MNLRVIWSLNHKDPNNRGRTEALPILEAAQSAGTIPQEGAAGILGTWMETASCKAGAAVQAIAE